MSNPEINHDTSHHDGAGTISTAAAVRLIAGREITTRAQGKAFRFSTLAFLVIIIGGLVLAKVLGGDDDATKVGYVGPEPVAAALAAAATASGQDYEVSAYPDRPAAERAITDGDIDAALVSESGSYTAVFEKEVDDTTVAIFAGAAQQVALAENLDASASAQLATAAEAGRLTVAEIEPEQDNLGQRIIIALAVAILLSMGLTLGGQYIAQGVVEEKTTRIVELLLATVRPIALLWGKILGIGTLVLGQVIVFATVALAGAIGLDLINVQATALQVAGVGLIGLLLGFLFMATAFAAAASLVSRQEDVGAATSPLLFLGMGSMYAVIFGIQAPDSTVIRTLAYVPPFSATVQPMRVATGDATAVEVVIALAILAVAALAVAWIAARIYEQSVLRTGTRIGWGSAIRGALSRGSAPQPTPNSAPQAPPGAE